MQKVCFLLGIKVGCQSLRRKKINVLTQLGSDILWVFDLDLSVDTLMSIARYCEIVEYSIAHLTNWHVFCRNTIVSDRSQNELWALFIKSS